MRSNGKTYICVILAILFAYVEKIFFHYQVLSNSIVKILTILVYSVGIEYKFDPNQTQVELSSTVISLETVGSAIEGFASFVLLLILVLVIKKRTAKRNRVIFLIGISWLLFYIENVFFAVFHFIATYNSLISHSVIWHLECIGLGIITSLLIVYSEIWLFPPEGQKSNDVPEDIASNDSPVVDADKPKLVKKRKDKATIFDKLKARFYKGPIKSIHFFVVDGYRLMVDLARLFWHSILVNLLKASVDSKRKKSECQLLRKDGSVLCKVSKEYDSPEFVKLICPLINLEAEGIKPYKECTAQKGETPLSLLRCLIFFTSVVTVLSFSFFILTNYSSEKIFGKYLSQEEIAVIVKKLQQEGHKLFKQKDHYQAEEKFRRVIVYQPENFEAHIIVAKCYEALDKIPQAIQYYLRASSLAPHDKFVNERLAHHYLNAEEFSLTEQYAVNIHADERSADIWGILAVCCIENQEYDKAVKFSLKGLLVDPANILCKKNLGIVACHRKNLKKAEKWLLPLVNSSYSTEIGQSLSWLYMKRGKTKQARELLDAISAKNPNSRVIDFSFAQFYFLQGNDKKAIEYCLYALKIGLQNVRLVGQVLDLLIQFRQFDLALSQAQSFLNEDPMEPIFHRVIAQVQIEKGFLIKAQEHCLKILEICKSNPKKYLNQIVYAHLLLGKIATLQQKPEQVIVHFSTVASLRSKNIASHLILAKALVNQRKYQEALKSYFKAIFINSNNLEAHMGVAAVYEQQSYKKAIDYLVNTTQDFSKSVKYQVYLAKLYALDNQFSKSAKLYKKIVDSKSIYSGAAANNLACILMEKSDPKKALKYARIAVSSNSRSIAYISTLGWALYKVNDLDNAKDIFNRLVAHNPKVAIFRYRLGVILMDKKNYLRAKQELKTAIKLLPEGTMKQDAIKRLDDLNK